MQQSFFLKLLDNPRHFIRIKAFSRVRIKSNTEHIINAVKLFQRLISKPLPKLYFLRCAFFKCCKSCSCLIIKLRMRFYFHMELRVIRKKGFNRFLDNILLITPMSVCADHLSELGAVISEMIDSNCFISKTVINLVNCISDYC